MDLITVICVIVTAFEVLACAHHSQEWQYDTDIVDAEFTCYDVQTTY